MSWALAGRSEADNLRVLCSNHNRFAADRCFGAEFMKRKIETVRCEKRTIREGTPRPDEVAQPEVAFAFAQPGDEIAPPNEVREPEVVDGRRGAPYPRSAERWLRFARVERRTYLPITRASHH